MERKCERATGRRGEGEKGRNCESDMVTRGQGDKAIDWLKKIISLLKNHEVVSFCYILLYNNIFNISLEQYYFVKLRVVILRQILRLYRLTLNENN